MLDVALWSRFPNSFIEQKIEPALKKRGIRVLKRLSDRTKKVDLSDVAVVLFLYDISSHSEESRINNLADAHGKKVICISRKESSWDRNLAYITKLAPSVGDDMASHSIPDDKVQAFCSEFEVLYRKGVTRKAMIPILSKYWTRGKLTNENQLHMMVRGLIDANRAPKSFAKWYDGARKIEKFVAPVTDSKKMQPALTSLPQAPSPTKIDSIPRAFQEKVDPDKIAYEQLLTEEAEKISKMQAEIRAKDEVLASLSKEHERLKAENAKLKEQPSDGVLRRSVVAISDLVELKMLSVEDGYKKLVDFVKR